MEPPDLERPLGAARLEAPTKSRPTCSARLGAPTWSRPPWDQTSGHILPPCEETTGSAPHVRSPLSLPNVKQTARSTNRARRRNMLLRLFACLVETREAKGPWGHLPCELVPRAELEGDKLVSLDAASTGVAGLNRGPDGAAACSAGPACPTHSSQEVSSVCTCHSRVGSRGLQPPTEGVQAEHTRCISPLHSCSASFAGVGESTTAIAILHGWLLPLVVSN